MLDPTNRDLAHRISAETARYINDYFQAKAKRLGQKVDPMFVYMAALGGTIAVVTSVISAIAEKSPELAAKLREDIVEKVGKEGLQ